MCRAATKPSGWAASGAVDGQTRGQKLRPFPIRSCLCLDCVFRFSFSNGPQLTPSLLACIPHLTIYVSDNNRLIILRDHPDHALV